MGDLSLNDLLRRAESLVEDLIWYFQSGMLKNGRPFEVSTNFDLPFVALTSKHLMSAILSQDKELKKIFFQSNGLLCITRINRMKKES